MKATIFDYYTKNHRQVLLLFILLGMGILYLPVLFPPKPLQISAEKIEEFNQLLHYTDSLNNRWQNMPIAINEISTDSLKELGFNKRLANSIERYKGFGRPIRSDKDMLRVYGMTDSILGMMDIIYNTKDVATVEEKQPRKIDIPRWQKETIFINLITLDSLLALGFPPKLSARLIKYRDVIHGFKDEEKLKATYGLTEYHLQKMQINYQLPDQPIAKPRPRPKKIKPKWATIPIKINEISLDSLIKLGLPEKLSNTIIKYRKTIGGYKDSLTLKKVYGLTDYYFQQMNIDYSDVKLEYMDSTSNVHRKAVQNPDDTTVQSSGFKKYVDYKPVTVIDINIATREELIGIYNIGAASADRIILLRDQLGGFYSIDQIKNTPRLHPDGFIAIKKNVGIITPHRKIDLSTSTEQSLSQHPYISEKQAQKIMIWIGAYPELNVDNLKESYIFSKKEWTRLKPYLQTVND